MYLQACARDQSVRDIVDRTSGIVTLHIGMLTIARLSRLGNEESVYRSRVERRASVATEATSSRGRLAGEVLPSHSSPFTVLGRANAVSAAAASVGRAVDNVRTRAISSKPSISGSRDRSPILRLTPPSGPARLRGVQGGHLRTTVSTLRAAS